MKHSYAVGVKRVGDDIIVEQELFDENADYQYNEIRLSKHQVDLFITWLRDSMVIIDEPEDDGKE